MLDPQYPILWIFPSWVPCSVGRYSERRSKKRKKEEENKQNGGEEEKKLTCGNFYKEQKNTKIDHYACTRVILWWAFLFFLDKLSSHFVNVTPSNNKNHTSLSAGQVMPSEQFFWNYKKDCQITK